MNRRPAGGQHTRKWRRYAFQWVLQPCPGGSNSCQHNDALCTSVPYPKPLFCISQRPCTYSERTKAGQFRRYSRSTRSLWARSKYSHSVWLPELCNHNSQYIRHHRPTAQSRASTPPTAPPPCRRKSSSPHLGSPHRDHSCFRRARFRRHIRIRSSPGRSRQSLPRQLERLRRNPCWSRFRRVNRRAAVLEHQGPPQTA